MLHADAAPKQPHDLAKVFEGAAKPRAVNTGQVSPAMLRRFAAFLHGLDVQCVLRVQSRPHSIEKVSEVQYLLSLACASPGSSVPSGLWCPSSS